MGSRRGRQWKGRIRRKNGESNVGGKQMEEDMEKTWMRGKREKEMRKRREERGEKTLKRG